jgi:protein-S-isoprenylcysteine O-methyltransferase Ste14
MYVTGVFIFLGVSILSASWVFLLFTIIFGVGVTRPYSVKVEEAQCLGHYGAAYREYMNRTPRWIGIPKSKKKNEYSSDNSGCANYFQKCNGN